MKLAMRFLKLCLKFSLVAVLTGACIPLIWILFSVFEPQIVLYQAKRVAGDRPYCIVVPDKNIRYKYNEVKNRKELNFNNLTTYLDSGGSGGPMPESYYALLIMQKPDDIWNWSKRSLDFHDDVKLTEMSIYKQDFTKFCTPVAGFADKISD